VKAIVIGGGPAGLMAAERLSDGGVSVDLYDAMPSLGRKFLLAGKGGLNLTHAEPFERFVARYGARQAALTPTLNRFGPDALRQWAHDLGIETFVGTSQRVFPKEMKAAPLLRAWLRRLRANGVRIHTRHRWCGWDGDHLVFETPDGKITVHGDAVVLALGGASWPQLGSDGGWVPLLQARNVAVASLQPANCGFDVGWSEVMRSRFAGQPIKPVVATFGGVQRQGEFIITETGVEGGLIYAFSSALRDAIAKDGSATLHLDLAPRKTREDLARSRGKSSLATHLKKRARLDGARAALVRDVLPAEVLNDDRRLAEALKALPLVLRAPRPIAEVISTAGGVRFEDVDATLMLNAVPGMFCAGEMLDWEAPTGGYLLTACFATGAIAGDGALAYLKAR
jgi:uncharacterized flavoprotein (TIGR03862 family)